jgi:hypothetical protein
MPDNRAKCIAGDRCSARTISKTVGTTIYYNGRKLSDSNGVKCAHPDCNKYACCDSIVCLSALKYHHNLEHGDPLFDFSTYQLHSLGHALTHHFGQDSGLEIARSNHNIISGLPDGLDSSEIGQSGRFNNWCSICHVNLGAYAFKDTADELVCQGCTKENDLSSSLRLWNSQ